MARWLFPRTMVVVALEVFGCGRSSATNLPDAGRDGTGGISCVGGGPPQATLDAVTAIVSRTCATADCHDSKKQEHGMDLSTARLIHGHFVGKRGVDHCTNAARFRVVPGDPDASFVMTKIQDRSGCGMYGRMPPAPASMLSACEIETIRLWIAAGAPGPVDGGADDAPDASVDAANDAPDPDADPEPGVCTATKLCDPVIEICVETEFAPTRVSTCYKKWECFTHLIEDETREHPCPAEIIQFCGCDGTTFERPYACPDRPYDHAGACGDGYSCDINRSTCADPAPTCAEGLYPAVVAGCWGPCVPISMCRCDQHWQCPQGDKNTCLTLPEFRCGLKPPAADAGGDTL